MHADVAQRNRGATVLEDLRDIVVGLQPYSAGAFHIQDRCHAGLDAFQAGNAGHQGFLGQQQALIQQLPEAVFVTLGLQSDTRQVQADHADIVAAIVDLLAVFFIGAEEAAATHRRFKGTGDLDHLIVIENVWIHAFAGTFQRQLFDVVVGVTKLVVQTVADGEDQFREHGGFTIFTQPGDTIFQDRLLDHARFPTGAQTETEGDKRRLAVGGMQSIDFIFQRLEGVVTLFLGAGHRIAFHVWDLPLLRYLLMLVEALGDEGGQDLINAVDGGTAINMAGNLSDDLRGHGGGGGDRLRRLDLGVTHLEAVGQHAFQIDQHTVEHREER
ncbi:hypothetical protein D3C79_535160 [compost metagenome]